MTKDEFAAILRAYKAAMGSMDEARRLEPTRGTMGDLQELGLDVALHLPNFIGELTSMGETKVPKSVKEVYSMLGNGYGAARECSPRAVLKDARLLLAALMDRLPEEKNAAVATLVDAARARLRQDDIYLAIAGVTLRDVPSTYNELR